MAERKVLMIDYSLARVKLGSLLLQWMLNYINLLVEPLNPLT
jgi:hypothetical protein